MLFRRSLPFVVCCSALVFVAAACQAFPVGGATPTATPRPTAPVSTTASLFENVVWGRVPDCGCRDGLMTGYISAALKRAQLPGTVKELSPTGGWMYFVVAFDPQTASRGQIAAAIVDGGGEVMAGPP